MYKSNSGPEFLDLKWPFHVRYKSTHGFAYAKAKMSIFNSKILEFVGNSDIILIDFQSSFCSAISIRKKSFG